MAINRILPQIDHVVMVMLENRSLDNLLGWLYEPGKKPQPHYIPANNTTAYDGLVGLNFSNPLKPHFYSRIKNYPVVQGTGSDGFNVPDWDPNEDFKNVMAQIFGDATHQPKAQPASGTVPTMKGFLQNFDADYMTWDAALQSMKTYSSSQARVINGLAQMGAVSDRWYSSLPSQTNPNRAFSLCGSSLGRTSNLHLTAIEQFPVKTIWNALQELPGQKVDWALYYHDIWQEDLCYTQYTFPYIDKDKSNTDVIEEIGTPGATPQTATGFYKRAMEGNLPAFTYIEPKWGYGLNQDLPKYKQGNDYHPPTDIRPGEQFLHDLTKAVMYNQAKWEKTLFIITFDEHGGTLDHHSPACTAPNPNVTPNPNPQSTPFNWELYGVRVPTILISPFIKPGTVFRADGALPYDHTSLVATLLKWKGIDPASVNMGDRVKTAPTFEDVLQPTLQPGWDINNIPVPVSDGPSIDDISPIDEIIDGLPTAIARCLTENSGSLEHLREQVKRYNDSGELPKEKFANKTSCLRSFKKSKRP